MLFFYEIKTQDCLLDWHVQADDLTIAKSELKKQRRLCIVRFHSLIHQEMTWHTAVRTSHQVHHDFIIEMFFSTRSRLKTCSLDWHGKADDLTVAKSGLQKQRRFCIVHFHSLIHQEITWHTAVRTSHQVHHDFIIKMLFFYEIKTQDFVTWIGTSKLTT